LLSRLFTHALNAMMLVFVLHLYRVHECVHINLIFESIVSKKNFIDINFL